MRKPLLILAALLAALVAGVAAPAAYADCVSDATVSYVGADWGPIPMWRVSVPSLNATWDVQAADADAARAAVAPFIHCPAAPAAPADPAPTDTTPTATVPTDTTPTTTTPAGPSDSAVNTATIVLADAEITYVGNSWGPLPIWRVHVPSRNATYDVAASTAEGARAAVLGAVAASIDANPTVTPAATASVSDAPTLAGKTGQVVEVSTPVAPAPAVVKVTPAKAKTAKKGVHKAPATAKRIPR